MKKIKNTEVRPEDEVIEKVINKRLKHEEKMAKEQLGIPQLGQAKPT